MSMREKPKCNFEQNTRADHPDFILPARLAPLQSLKAKVTGQILF